MPSWCLALRPGGGPGRGRPRLRDASPQPCPRRCPLRRAAMLLSLRPGGSSALVLRARSRGGASYSGRACARLEGRGRPGSRAASASRRIAAAAPAALSIAARGDAPQPEAGRERANLLRPRPEERGAEVVLRIQGWRARISKDRAARLWKQLARPAFNLMLIISKKGPAVAGGAFLYILLCADGSYYTGTTRADLELRVAQHNAGTYAGSYTAQRRPVTLVFAQWFDRITDAIEAERQVKGWSRAKKEALIRGEFERLPELSKRRQRQAPKE
jgi:putative endonuclease